MQEQSKILTFHPEAENYLGSYKDLNTVFFYKLVLSMLSIYSMHVDINSNPSNSPSLSIELTTFN